MLLLIGVAVAVFVACNRGTLPRVFVQASPHEAYTRALENAGLGNTALVRDWKAAADAALRKPAMAAPPVNGSVRFTASQATAFGYRLELQRGRTLHVQVTYTGDAPAAVFLDLFTVGSDAGTFTRVANAPEGQLVLDHEVARSGVHILRVQPELLRGGTLQIDQRTTASLQFPVSGRTRAAVRSFFGDERDGGRRDHHGVDIFAPHETPVLAASDGIVTGASTNRLGGNVVWIWDPDRRQSHYYAHLSRHGVSPGTRVQAGTVIGYVGNTGNARTTPPHLHFGIYSFGEGPIDPLPFIAP